MIIEQTVTIPANNKIFLELPPFVPSGITALIKIDIPAVKDINNSHLQNSSGIDEIRKLLQNEMADKGTLEVKTASGDGWVTHVREHYAEF